MKSFLSRGAIYALCLVWISVTASAQEPVYGPTMLLPPAQQTPAYVPASGQYPGNWPVITASEAAGMPSGAYENANSSLLSILGQPPAASAPGTGPEYLDSQHADPYDVAPLSAKTLGCSACAPCGNWFGGLYGMIMRPDRDNPFNFSVDSANGNLRLTRWQDAEIQWGGGFDVRFGRYLNCGRNAVEVVYWGLFPDEESTFTTADAVTGNLNAVLNWDSLTYAGVGANTLVDNAEIHGLWHEQEYHNVEVNLLRLCGTCGGHDCSCHASRLRSRCLLGVRWFKFHDNLLFGADTIDRQFTGAPEEVYYNIDLDNDLVGVQLGCEGEYCLHPCWSFDYGIKLGLYGNHISHVSEIGGAAGVATINNGANNGVEFFVDNSKNDLAFLGEANLGLEYRYRECLTATLGYRALAATGVALPTSQIYGDLRSILDIQQVDSNGSLILHGVFMGVEFNY